MKPNMIKKWSIALLVAAGATGLTGCEGMRVDEGAGTATNNGNIAVSPNGAALKANLSGTVNDDFGVALSGVSVYAYGRTTTTDAGGNWILTDVPVTGVNINSTPQNLEQTTDVTTTGKIYITYSKDGYSQYKSAISNPGVITHYGTAGGNPNSIIVDNLVASEAVQLPQLINTVTGTIVDKGSYYTAPVGEYDFAKSLTVRLVPATDVVNNAYGSAAQTGAAGTECYEGCGFYSVEEIVTTTTDSGQFTFTNVPKIPGGYIMRVDDPGYRPMARPNDGTGFSYDYDSGNVGTLGDTQSPWSVSTQAHENQNYWWGIDFDVKVKAGTLTNLDTLYVGDFLVAPSNQVEGITVGGLYGYADENSGTLSDDQHNPNLGADASNDNTIDYNLVNLATTPLKFIFSGDMVPQAFGTIPATSIVIFDNGGNQIAWDSAKTKIEGRTLTLQLSERPGANSTIYVRLHKDVFVSMSGQRLTPQADPNQTDYSGATVVSSDPANDATGRYAEYEIVYKDTLINPPAVENVVQGNLNLRIPLTASLTSVAAAGGTSLSALHKSNDWRLEELLDAILVRTDKSDPTLVDKSSNATNVNTFVGTTAVVNFTAVNGGTYRINVQDADGVSLVIAANVASEENSVAGVDTGDFTLTTGTTGSTFLDFTATVGSDTADATAKVTIANTKPGYKVTIRRLNDFGDITAGSTGTTVTLKDNFEPHVAIQNSGNSGQDTASAAVTGTLHGSLNATAAGAAGAINSSNTAETLFTCGIERSDDNGEAEVGDAAYYFPKLNLTASLYDKSNLRAHTETGGLLSTAIDQGQTGFVTAEDGSLPTAALIVNSLKTPLLATTAATATDEGTTTSGRSDEYYTSADYDAWGKIATTAAGPTCQYYVAEISTNTGIFQNNWLPSTSAGVGTTVGGAGSVADDDNSQASVPTTGTLAGYSLYTVGGVQQTYTYTLNTTPATTQTGNIIVGPSNCGTAAGSVYDFDRTVVLNMTEAVVAPDNLTDFAAKTGVCQLSNGTALTNIPTGELSAASGLTAITNKTTGWNDDHLLLTFGDWRTIDDSNHFTDSTQADVANELSEGSSLNDLLQIVSLKDSGGIEATAGNGSGVLIVDATPPLATALTNDGSSVTVKFDQTINLGNSNAFTLHGEHADGTLTTYNFTITSASAGTVTRTTDYIGPYGNLIEDSANNTAGTGRMAQDPIDVTIAPAANADANVPGATTNSQLTFTIAESSTNADGLGAGVDGQQIDLSLFFNELSHTSANSVTAASSVADPSFHMRYDALQDASFNSWGSVERADAYDGDDGTAPTTANGVGPRLVGTDNDGPRLETQNATPATVGSINEAFLHVDSSSGLSVTGLHATDDADGDSIYTPDTTANYAVSATEDIPLSYVWGYDAAVPSPANAAATTVDIAPTDSTVLAVIKLDQDVDVTQAISYIYRPNREEIDDFNGGTINTTVVASGTLASALNVTYSSGARVAGEVGHRANDANNGGFSTLVVELPAPPDSTVWSTDALVIQNILNTADDTYYSIHIKAPVATATTVSPGTTEPNPVEGTDLVIYKQVFLGDGTVASGQTDNIVEEIRSGLAFGNANSDFSANAHLQYREEINTATATWTAGSDDDAAEAEEISFTPSVTDSNGYVTVVLDPVAAGSITEATTKFVGNDAALSVTATDFSGKASSATITLQKGHGSASNASNDFDLDNGGNADDDNQEIPILNIISGSAID